jgi:hypothetical protein
VLIDATPDADAVAATVWDALRKRFSAASTASAASPA